MAGKQANVNKDGFLWTRQNARTGGGCKSQELHEDLDIAAAATTSTTIAIPANSALEGVSFYVINAVPGMTGSTMDVGITGTAAKFFNDVKCDADGESGVKHVANEEYTSSTTILVTPLSTPTAGGKIKFVLYYKQITAPNRAG